MKKLVVLAFVVLSLSDTRPVIAQDDDPCGCSAELRRCINDAGISPTALAQCYRDSTQCIENCSR